MPMNANNIDLSVSIPLYNEEDNVRSVIKELYDVLKNTGLKYEIIAVNNGSYDNTGKILNKLKRKYKNIKIVSIKKNLGYSYGINQGLKKSNGRIIGFMDGDSQVKSNVIPLLYKELENNKDIQLIKVKRVRRMDGFNRLFQSRIYNKLFAVLFGIDSIDINGKPKLMKREFYDKINIISRDWFIDAEIMLNLKKHNYKFAEIAVQSDKRNKGESKVKLSATLQFLKNMLKYKLGFFYRK